MIRIKTVANKMMACIGILVLFNAQIYAQTLRIAVAANAQAVIKKLQVDFKKQTGINTEVISGASGKLTTQIMNGAPYDVFLSADTEFPAKLFAAGYGIQKPKLYALGSLIICGNVQGDIKDWQKLVSMDVVKKMAIANPKTAPYGYAALQSLKFYNLENKIKHKLVFGESIAQVNTYLQTGVVGLGFTTESFLYENGFNAKLKWARVDQKSYKNIEQAVILLSHAKKSGINNALKFYEYLSSASARKIIKNNGYHLPN
jgi:molybdate transport system substrate-binding protein